MGESRHARYKRLMGEAAACRPAGKASEAAYAVTPDGGVMITRKQDLGKAIRLHQIEFSEAEMDQFCKWWMEARR